jgi:uncharacterized cupredoxin-like copper-binding protein
MPLTKTILPAAGAAIALAAAVAGCNNSSSAQPPRATPPPTGGPVQATIDEWSVKASPATAAAGKVTFDVRNTGKVKHEFVVLRTDKPADGLGTGARVSESGNVGEAGDLAPGASKSVTIKLPAGHYALVCNLPGHYKAGMHTDFTVR